MLRTIPFASTLLMAALAFTLGFLRSQPPGASIRAIGAIQPRISPDGTSIASFVRLDTIRRTKSWSSRLHSYESGCMRAGSSSCPNRH
jgi:hypothetical protein